MKKCIFHYPMPIDERPGVGSALRPNRMLAAFRELGYEVDAVTGYGAERKAKIAEIKAKIAAGEKYDFLYSESVNTPTLLAEEDHIPRFPFLDFSFLHYCRKRGISTGLFYRDMHWRMPYIFKSVSFWKRCVLKPLFRYDLLQYRRVLDMVFLPSLACRNYVPKDMASGELPPGGEWRADVLAQKQKQAHAEDGLHLFYVGGVSGQYDIREFCRAVCETEGVYLTLCTPADQWEAAKSGYEGCLCDRIEVVHLTSSELRPCYERADVSLFPLRKDVYSDLAMPIKVFEAISYGTPILSTDVDAVAAMIREKQIGWVCRSDKESFKAALEHLKAHPEEIAEKTSNTVAAAPENTWTSRAARAAKVLTHIKEAK